MKKWVDITTLNNTTPFGKVRWLQNLTIAYNTSNFLEFSELSGITIDGRSWSSNSGPSWGYASTHRVANNDDSFTCTFLNEYRTSNDVTVSSSNSTAGTAVHDVKRSVYYDDVVTMSGQTFYEVDFTTWSGYTPLYYCYTGTSVSAGQVYVEIGSDPIVVDKDKLSFKSSGETKNVVIESDNPWTATTSEAWVSLSTSAGTSGETTLSVTAPEYTATTENRTATITITDGEFSVTINVKQAKKREGGVSEMYLGTLNMESAYFGGLEVEAMYLGENEVYSNGPFVGLIIKPESKIVPYSGGIFEIKIKSSEDWTLSMDPTYLSADTYSGTTGESIVTITADTYTGNTDIESTITATTASYSAETTVKYSCSIDGLNFLFNFNAKDYDASTRTIPNHSAGTLSQNMVFKKTTNSSYSGVASAITASSDHISFSAGTYAQFAYNNASDSPFNITDNEPNLTVIVKMWRNPDAGSSIWAGTPQSDVLSNRGNNPNSFNWLLRCSETDIYAITTEDSDKLSWSAIPVTVVYRITNKQLQIKNITEGTSTPLTTTTYSQPTNRVTFFGMGYQLSATDVRNCIGGDFYWMFLSRDSLTDEQIQQVIDYNNNL